MFLHLTIAFLSAAIVAYNSIYSSERFNSYFFLFYRHWSLFVYVGVYGVLGILLYAILKEQASTILESDLTITPKILLAIGTGVASKGVANFVIFTIRTGGEPVPIGLHTITRVIDNYFENIFDTVCFTRMAGFCDAEIKRFRKMKTQKLKQLVISELASHPARDKIGVFAQSIKNAASNKEILDKLLCFFGKTIYRELCNRIEI